MTTWCTAEEAVRVVQSGNRVYVQGFAVTPTPLLQALTARGQELENVEIVHLHTYGPTPYTDPQWAGHFLLRAIFVSDNTRQAINSGRGTYTPIFLSDVPATFRHGGEMAIDVAFIQVSPPDSHGCCSLGPAVDATLAAVNHARHVVALVNPHVPRAHGMGFINFSRIEYAVHCSDPLYVTDVVRPNDVQSRIGRYTAELIEDGATLQMGIGAIPNAVLSELGDRRNLGIHTEMFSDGVINLVKKGVITGARKKLDPGKIVSSFAIGSQELMDFIDDNPMVEFYPFDYTNDSHIIRQFDHMVSINSAIQVDLTGQVCAESIGTYIYSGVGGQMDFLRGAALSPNGKPIIALPSTVSAKKMADEDLDAMMQEPIDGQISRITPFLAPGASVTTTKAHLYYVITEYGVAYLHGLSLKDRALKLIEIAAPQFREQLERAAFANKLLAR